jgi:hypothetical protein
MRKKEKIFLFFISHSLSMISVISVVIYATTPVNYATRPEQHIFPLEVKAGFSKKKKSLLVYAEKFSGSESTCVTLSRASLRNFAFDGNIINYPLYAIELFPRFRCHNVGVNS